MSFNEINTVFVFIQNWIILTTFILLKCSEILLSCLCLEQCRAYSAQSTQVYVPQLRTLFEVIYLNMFIFN